MICHSLCLLIILIYALLLGVYTEYVKEAQCNQDLIDNILKLGKQYGNIDKVFHKPGLDWTVKRTTNTPEYNNVTCQKYYTQDNGQLTVSSDGVKSTVSVKEIGARLFIKGDRNLHYKFLFSIKKKIYSGYVCSKDGPEVSKENPPNLGLVITSCKKQESIEEAKEWIKKLGYELTKKFTCKD